MNDETLRRIAKLIADRPIVYFYRWRLGRLEVVPSPKPLPGQHHFETLKHLALPIGWLTIAQLQACERWEGLEPKQ